MNEHEQKAILTLSLMAAFADGNKDESERAELKRIADALAGEASINLAALYMTRQFRSSRRRVSRTW